MVRLLAVFIVGLVLLGGGIHLAFASSSGVRVARHAGPPGAVSSQPSRSSGEVRSKEERSGLEESRTISETAMESVAARFAELPGGETLNNRRGFWSTDSTGRETRISKGPTPRLNALVPILMYHNVRPIDFATTNAFVSSLTLPPSEFDKQLLYLRERGFSTISMLDLSQHLRGLRSLPPRPIVLTFDDGFENNHQYAFTLLKSRGFTGTFYVITGLVGRTEYMVWSQVADLARGGMEIGSHTINHPDLAHTPAAALERELVQSRRTLEEVTGRAVTTLSYPSGAYNEQVVAAARQAGYASAVTTRNGGVQSGARPLEMTRVRIQGTEQIATFKWKIEQFFPTGDPVRQ